MRDNSKRIMMVLGLLMILFIGANTVSAQFGGEDDVDDPFGIFPAAEEAIAKEMVLKIGLLAAGFIIPLVIKKSGLVVKIGGILVMVHSLLLFILFMQLRGGDLEGSANMGNIALNLDIISWSVLGFGLLAYAKGSSDHEVSDNAKKAGLIIVIFAVIAVMWRTVIPAMLFYTATSSEDYGSLFDALLNTMKALIGLFFLNSIVLMVAGIFYNKMQVARGKKGKMFIAFGAVNLVGVLLLTLPMMALFADPEAVMDSGASLDGVLIFGLLLKMLIAPIMGMIAGITIMKSFGDDESSSGMVAASAGPAYTGGFSASDSVAPGTHAAQPAAAPAPAAPVQQGQCPTCRDALTYVKDYDAWYCYTCAEYKS